MEKRVEVLVIGASQAGLAMGYYLKQQRLSFLIVGQESRVGDVWRDRYDSLVLFTPRQYSSLPAMALEGDPHGFATKDEIADYLEAYADHFDLPIELGTTVNSLEKDNEVFIAKTTTGVYVADKVVIATGPFQRSYMPSFQHDLSPEIYQTHTAHYTNPSQLQDGSVLVVGAGNSGAQIAVELAADRPVTIAVGHKMRYFPLTMFGRSIFWWFDKLGLLQANIDTALGRMIRKKSDPIFGKELKTLIQQGRVKVKPRAIKATADTVYFEDGKRLQPSNVIWATGFRSDYSWLQHPEVLDHHAMPIHHRGITALQGLYFLGLPWQYRRFSALIGGVGTDAEFLLREIMS